MKNSQLALSRIKKKHDVRIILKNFETFEYVQKERTIRVAMLRKSDNRKDAKVADILVFCKKGKRCNNAACSICPRRYRIRLVGNEIQIFGDGDDTRIITLIVHDRLVSSKDLFSLDVRKMMRRLTKQIERSGLKHIICVGGFEIKHCYERGLWIPHFHLIVKGSTYAEREKFREKFYKSNDIIYRPMKVQKIKKPVRQYSYCLKYFSLRPVDWETSTGKIYEIDVRLEPFEHNLYLRFMSQYHVKDLVFKRGAKSEGEIIRILKK